MIYSYTTLTSIYAYFLDNEISSLVISVIFPSISQCKTASIARDYVVTRNNSHNVVVNCSSCSEQSFRINIQNTDGMLFTSTCIIKSKHCQLDTICITNKRGVL